MAKETNISWAHCTQNFEQGCDKIAPECAHCYIERTLRQQHLEPWGKVYRSKSTWGNPDKWERECAAAGFYKRVFTDSLSDFFHVGADAWRHEAWQIIERTPHLIYLILTKRPELIAKRLPPDWPYANVWLGVSTGCIQTLNKMDSLRKIEIHPEAVRFVSAEPLLEDISRHINLAGYGWLIAGGESGNNPEYLWEQGDWRKEFNIKGRRTMKLEWARSLKGECDKAEIPYWFKQITAGKSGKGSDALGRIWHGVPSPPKGGRWAK